jgi:hypothetical protein
MEADFASSQSGALISLATSCDARHEPSCVLDPAVDKFWTTTGCYPQEIVVKLPQRVHASNITVKMVNGVILF